MPISPRRSVVIFRVHPAVLMAVLLGALLLQTFLPLKLPLARLMDFPLLVTIYFALIRRDKVFGMGLGTGLGLLQDALSHGYIGIFGIAKAIVGYLAASASTRFELESLIARIGLTSIFVLTHGLCVAILQHALLEPSPPIELLVGASSFLVNVSLGLVLFQILDRLRRPV